MDSVVIVCETIRDEYLDAAEKCGCTYETRWIESGLHNVPDKLRSRLQDELDSITHKRVLLCFGTCGNSVIGLETRDFELVIPRVDDCISMLIGSVAQRTKINSSHSAYFLTAGWLRGERNIFAEYEYTLEKYGDVTGKEIMDVMLANYKNLALLDTGSYDLKDAKDESQRIANVLDLELMVLPASVNYITQLLTGPHDPDRFSIFPPNTKLEAVPLA